MNTMPNVLTFQCVRPLLSPSHLVGEVILFVFYAKMDDSYMSSVARVQVWFVVSARGNSNANGAFCEVSRPLPLRCPSAVDAMLWGCELAEYESSTR